MNRPRSPLPRAFQAALAVGLLGAIAGCGSSSQASGGSTSPTSVATASASPRPAASAAVIANATFTRDKLLAAAPVGSAVPKSGEMTEIWQTVIPGGGFSGSALEATASSVSGFAFVLSKSKNLEFLVFAVRDTSGKCAGGVLEASGSGNVVTKAAPLSGSPATCAASRFSDAAGY